LRNRTPSPKATPVFETGYRPFSGTFHDWYRRRDSNSHCSGPEPDASYRLGYVGVLVRTVRLELTTSAISGRHLCRLGYARVASYNSGDSNIFSNLPSSSPRKRGPRGKRRAGSSGFPLSRERRRKEKLIDSFEIGPRAAFLVARAGIEPSLTGLRGRGSHQKSNGRIGSGCGDRAHLASFKGSLAP
jgi:hypothetical protein